MQFEIEIGFEVQFEIEEYVSKMYFTDLCLDCLLCDLWRYAAVMTVSGVLELVLNIRCVNTSSLNLSLDILTLAF